MKATPVEIDWNPELSIFAYEPFLEAVSDEFGWLGGVDHTGKLRCVLPYTIVKKAIFRMVRFRVETVTLEEDLSIEEERSFLSSAMEFFRSIKADMVIPATTNTIFRTYPDGADSAPYGTYIVDLGQPEEKLLSNLSSSHRRKVRQAMKIGVKILDGKEYAETAHTLVRDTFKRSSISFMDFNSFSRMVDSLGEKVKILVAEHEGVVQGAIVVPYSIYSAYYVYGGSIPNPANGSMVFLHWEAIRQFRSLLVVATIAYYFYNQAARLRSGGDIVDAERHKLKAAQS